MLDPDGQPVAGAAVTITHTISGFAQHKTTSIQGIFSVVILDLPTAQMIKELERDGVIEPGMDPTELCGLHTGSGITERGVDDTGLLPDQIHLFREGIVDTADGWDQEHADELIYEEIRITLLHELGHHFGLDEDDLDELGYA